MDAVALVAGTRPALDSNSSCVRRGYACIASDSCRLYQRTACPAFGPSYQVLPETTTGASTDVRGP